MTGLFQGLRKGGTSPLSTFNAAAANTRKPKAKAIAVNARSLRRSFFTSSDSMTVHHLPRAPQGTWYCTSDRYKASSADLSVVQTLHRYVQLTRQPDSPAPKSLIVIPTLSLHAHSIALEANYMANVEASAIMHYLCIRTCTRIAWHRLNSKYVVSCIKLCIKSCRKVRAPIPVIFP